MKPFFLIFIIVAIIVFIILLVGIFIIFNLFQKIRVHIQKTAADIEVLLKQRFDEIPNLVNICKGALQHEKNLLNQLIELRSEFTKTQQHDSEKLISELNNLDKDFSQSLDQIIILTEDYPELTSSQQFLYLQQRLSQLEDQIADRREYYNEAVAIHNARLLSFPDMILKLIFRYQEKDFLSFEVKNKLY